MSEATDGFRRIVKNAVTLLGGNVGAQLIGLAATAIAGRYLGPELFGLLVLVQTYALIVDAALNFQSWQALIKYGAEALERRDLTTLGALMRFGAALDVTTAVLGAGVAALAAGLYGRFQGWEPETSRLAVLYALVILFNVTGMPRAVLRLFDRFRLIAAQQIVAAGVRLLGVLSAVVAGSDVRTFIIVWIAAEIAGQLVLVAVALRELARNGVPGLFAGPIARPSRHPGLLAFVWTTNLNGSVKLVARELDVVLVGSMLGSAAAGIYRIAKQFAGIVAKLADPFYQAVFPELARLWARGSRAAFRALVVRTTLPMLGVTAVAWVGFVLFGRLLLDLTVGGAYRDAYAPMIWYMIGVVLSVAGICLHPAALAMGRPRTALGIQLGSTTIYFPVLYLLMREWGLVGAGAAWAVYYVVWTIGALLLVARGARGPDAPVSADRRRDEGRSPAALPRWARAFLHYGYVPRPASLDPLVRSVSEGRRRELARASRDADELIRLGALALRAAFDDPGAGPHVVPLSGGFDSRAVLAGVLERVPASEIRTVTFGTPGTMDFEIARRVTRSVGVRSEAIDVTESPLFSSERLRALARERPSPLPLHERSVNALLAERYEGATLWSGYLGDASAGAHAGAHEPMSGGWNAARRRFAARNAFLRPASILPDGAGAERMLPDGPIVAEETLGFDDQLDFAVRQPCFVAPIVRAAGARCPFADPAWISFCINLPIGVRAGAAFYRELLVRSFPALFALPTKNTFGAPATAGHTRISIARARATARKYAARVLPRARRPAHLMTNYADWNRLFWTDAAPVAGFVELIEALAARRVVDRIDPLALLSRTRRGEASGSALVLLASLEVYLELDEAGVLSLDAPPPAVD